MNDDYCVLGLDGGGSKTECAILSSSGQVLGVGLGGSSNLNYSSLESVRESIETACRLAEESAADRMCGIRRIGFAVVRGVRDGAPMTSQAIQTAELAGSLAERFEAEIEYLAEGDVALGCIDVFDHIGVACIAGTGSSCVGFGRDKRRIVRGGWGSPLGDEGGAYDIGIQGIRAAGKALEGRAPETRLVALAAEFFGEQPDGWLLRRIGPKAADMRPEIARFARMVAAAADDGDEVAKDILERAADDLAGLTICTATALFSCDEQFPIALHGGVLSNSRVADRVREIVVQQFPSSRVVQSIHSPGVGAALIALNDLRAGILRTDDSYE